MDGNLILRFNRVSLPWKWLRIRILLYSVHRDTRLCGCVSLKVRISTLHEYRPVVDIAFADQDSMVLLPSVDSTQDHATC